MNTFKHKSLYAALAGLGALGATGVAQAVSVNHDGLGQVLIYPYYTVRTVPTGVVGIDAAYNSLLSVVNSTASAKAVKVRFLEGKNSREVLDFNLYLSAQGRLDHRDHPDHGWRGHLHGGQVLHDPEGLVELGLADRVRQLRLHGQQRRQGRHVARPYA